MLPTAHVVIAVTSDSVWLLTLELNLDLVEVLGVDRHQYTVIYVLAFMLMEFIYCVFDIALLHSVLFKSLWVNIFTYDKAKGTVFYRFCYMLLWYRLGVWCCTLPATRSIARTTGRYLKLTETCRRYTVRTCVYWPSCFSTTRRSITTSSRSSSTFWHCLIAMDIISSAISPRFTLQRYSAHVSM